MLGGQLSFRFKRDRLIAVASEALPDIRVDLATSVIADGKNLGLTPLFRKPLPPGKHRIHAACSCGKTRTLTVTIQPGTAAPPIKLTW